MVKPILFWTHGFVLVSVAELISKFQRQVSRGHHMTDIMLISLLSISGIIGEY